MTDPGQPDRDSGEKAESSKPISAENDDTGDGAADRRTPRHEQGADSIAKENEENGGS